MSRCPLVAQMLAWSIVATNAIKVNGVPHYTVRVMNPWNHEESPTLRAMSLLAAINGGLTR